ncbi:phosphoenolpyruvate--protein phosphotransferase [Thiolapillus sp.]|uniref:phosphoenolpyruvate--protein phosphotransferase n=1 Tax=Thiolapillus sp. TaxID=2017437 RepID=UPI003AF6293C
MTLAIQGIGVDTSISTAIGKVLMLSRGNIQAEPGLVAGNRIEEEIQRFFNAVKEAAGQLREIRKQIPKDTPPDILEFIDTHLLMLEDKAISEAPAQTIREEGCSAEWALQMRRNQLMRVFEDMEDAYLRTRKDDLDHVVNRILHILQGGRNSDPAEIAGHIIVSEDLTPADAIMLHQRGAIGFITDFGSPMSHTAILARSLGIPAVVGAHGATSHLHPGELVVIDARHGSVLANCDNACLLFFRRRLEQEQAHRHALHNLRDTPALSLDGQQIELLANIELPEDTEPAIEGGCSGVGLYRTEFLYMNREELPTEEEHFQAYSQVVKGMGEQPVTIRTLDLGADKQCEYQPEPASCTNPALGLRAIRLCLKETVIFRIQIRAILRVSARGNVRMMLPMLTNLWEARQARQIIKEERLSLMEQGKAFDPEMPIGAMIETPAAALTAESFARLFDFLSIGTNDLIQYTLAVDRADDAVNHLYNALHPAVIMLIQQVVKAGITCGKPVAMCGEMAGTPGYIPLLLGMGLRSLSMHPASLPEAKQLIRNLDISQLEQKTAGILQNLLNEDLEQAVQSLTE